MRKSIEFYREAYQKYSEIQSGRSTRELSSILGVDPTTISAWRRGRTPESRYGGLDGERISEAKYMLESGYSYNQVSRTLSVSPTTLAKRFPNLGWKPGMQHVVMDYELDRYL